MNRRAFLGAAAAAAAAIPLAALPRAPVTFNEYSRRYSDGTTALQARQTTTTTNRIPQWVEDAAQAMAGGGLASWWVAHFGDTWP